MKGLFDVRIIPIVLAVGFALAAHGSAQAASCVPQPQCLGGFKPVTTVTQATKSLTSGILSNIVPQLQAMDWYASQPSGGTGADSVEDPYAHQCLPAAIAWIQSLPTLAPLPTPPQGQATGIFVEFEVAHQGHARRRARERDRPERIADNAQARLFGVSAEREDPAVQASE